MKSKKGFTLIEMMIVIAIIAVLVAVVIPVMNGSTTKAAAAANAANLRNVEGEMVTMMLLNPEAYGDQAGQKETIDDLQSLANSAQEIVTAANTVLNQLSSDKADKQQALENAQAAYNADKSISNYRKLFSAGLAVEAAALAERVQQAAIVPLQEALDAANGALADAVYNLYHFTAVDGVITLEDGTKIQAPSAKAVSSDIVEIAEDEPMVVYVDLENKEAYAMYGTYDKSYFAAVAGGDTSADE